MLRIVAGVTAAFLAVAAGFVIWAGQAEADDPVLPAPPAARTGSLLRPGTPPSAPPDLTAEQKRFARYDPDEDGTITRREMMGTRLDSWKRLDTDGNGSLSFEEWAIKTSEKFAEADADRSGALDAAEFRTTKRETKRKSCSC